MAFRIDQTTLGFNVIDKSVLDVNKQIVASYYIGDTFVKIEAATNKLVVYSDCNSQSNSFKVDNSQLYFKDIAGVETVWNGVNDDLIDKVNSYLVSATSATSATEAKQTEQINQATNYFGKKAIGRTIDLADDVSAAWSGYPLQFSASQLDAFTFRINNIVYDVPNDVQINTVEDLVSLLNANQNYLVFSAIDSTNLAVNNGSLSVVDLEEFYIRTSNFGSLFYDTFTTSAAVALSNVDEINEKLNKLNKQVELLQEIVDNTAAVAHKHFTVNTGTTPVTLTTQNVEYFLFAFRVKTGMGTVQMNAFSLLVRSLTNDDLLIKVGKNKTLSTALTGGNFASVDTDSKLEVAKSGVLGVGIRTATGFATGGRDFQSFEVIQGGSNNFNSDQEPLVEGEIMYITATPLGGGANCRYYQDWEEPQG